ncbi:MAG TPA: sigma 54-interacting transcriptional regulator [Polyangiaceae bacterium LLY-WYZ-15_(1-7)]|nr:sigma 54-interacting transcriptional regulator [Polyangiaceae bacterium LLY-WYZ-15_(1-7)]HJL45162.1 sigma 54-interacting transcriptional regulator [Polyangiaceae bacterium LLY-WYZ-15_(1-7)]
MTEFAGMITTSPEMVAFFETVRRVAKTDVSALIRGETGTGKEMVAKAIHTLSVRSGRPFLGVNCATFTLELLASELFGHVRGAFTGAVKDRAGLFARADGGTLFLDEIAEIDPGIQAQLLRVLQEKTFVPVGGTDPIRVDVRVLAATHKALRTEVERGRFRADLMYRIRVVPLFLPPLRDRLGDVEALAWHFVDELNERGLRRVDAIEEAVFEAMLAHDWPGNVRELRNVVEHAFAVGEGPVLRVGELTPELRGEPPPSPHKTARDLERERLLEALRETGGRKGEAAKLLGISRSTLWRKCREHQL